MRYKTLEKKLKELNKKQTDSIKWAYYGYGIYSCSGEDTLKELPKEVLFAKCFKYENDIFYVDGAL